MAIGTIDGVSRTSCESSNLASYGYDESRRVLAVEFKSSGHILHYRNVDLGTWERMLDAESKGSFYAKHVKGRFPADPMTGKCPKCGDEPGAIGTICTDCGCSEYFAQERRTGTNG
jgi:hypothetical protein